MEILLKKKQSLFTFLAKLVKVFILIIKMLKIPCTLKFLLELRKLVKLLEMRFLLGIFYFVAENLNKQIRSSLKFLTMDLKMDLWMGLGTQHG